ncbi:tRNA (cytidine(34)-2'-O)-methyltransferase [Candidatus Hydrogenedentota bacterium]
MMTTSQFEIALIEPEIPQNTGNIARLCAATGTPLHLVGKLGFSLEDKYMRRAGLDYWPLVDLRVHPKIETFHKTVEGRRLVYTSTHGNVVYHKFDFKPRDILVLGKESVGLPKELVENHEAAVLRIPVRDGVRSLNIGNAAGILLYEGLRQLGGGPE